MSGPGSPLVQPFVTKRRYVGEGGQPGKIGVAPAAICCQVGLSGSAVDISSLPADVVVAAIAMTTFGWCCPCGQLAVTDVTPRGVATSLEAEPLSGTSYSSDLRGSDPPIASK